MNRIVRAAALYLACLLFNADDSQAQDMRPSKGLAVAIDRFIDNLEVTDTEPGVAILVHEPGRLLYKKGFGLANLKTGLTISTRTLFELASCSKPFTATAVLLLVDRNMLSLDQDVRTILPELPEYRPKSPILVRDLLSHTSGLPEYFDFEVTARNPLFADNADYLPMFARLKSDSPQEFKAGSKFRYCNSNYLLLALIVERVSGKRFSEFMKKEVFTPLRMNDTFIYDSPGSVQAANRAVGYEWSKKKQKWSPTWGTPPDRNEDELIVGDGGVWTNLEDMLKWDNAIRARKILKPDTWKQALNPAATRKGEPLEYGLGWSLDYEDAPVEGFGHDGSWGGFITNYYHSYLSGRTTILLCNRSDFDSEEMRTELDRIIDVHQKK